jgi:PIN like domain
VPTPKRPDSTADRPTFFIDRDLGRIAFPNGLRAAGLSVVTLAEHYGVPADQQVEDHAWMIEAAGHSWPVFGCDSKHRKRRRPAERAALIGSGLQLFVLNGQVTAAENVARVLANLDDVYAACRGPGPFIYRVHPSRIELLRIHP